MKYFLSLILLLLTTTHIQAFSWEETTLLSAQAHSNYDYALPMPHHVINDAQNGMAVWNHYNSIRVCPLLNGNWGKDFNLSDRFFDEVQIVMYDTDKCMIAWIDRLYRVYIAHFSQGILEGIQQIHEEGYNFSLQLKINALGNAMLFWASRPLETYNVTLKYAEYINGNWSHSQSIADIKEIFYQPQFDYSDAGNAIVLWVENKKNGQLRYATYNEGVWIKPEILCTKHSEDPKVALDASGNGIAIWTIVNKKRYHLALAKYDPATGWSQPEFISNDAEIIYPYLIMNQSGNAIITWYTVKGSHYKLKYSLFNNKICSLPKEITAFNQFIDIKIIFNNYNEGLALYTLNGVIKASKFAYNSYSKLEDFLFSDSVQGEINNFDTAINNQGDISIIYIKKNEFGVLNGDLWSIKGRTKDKDTQSSSPF